MGLGGLGWPGAAGEEGAAPFRPFRSAPLPQTRLSTWPSLRAVTGAAEEPAPVWGQKIFQGCCLRGGGV